MTEAGKIRPLRNGELLIISETFPEIDLEMDMENMKMKEEMKNRLSSNGYFGFTYSFAVTNAC